MSLAQLERQIQVATAAMEQAKQSGDRKLTGEMKKELYNFKLVLEKSKARLRELEDMKKNCNELSTRRVHRMSQLNSDDASATKAKSRSSKRAAKDKDKTKSYLSNPIVIPWLQPKAKKEEKKREKKEVKRSLTPQPPSQEDRDDAEQEEVAGLLKMAMEYHNQVIGTGTQIFTSSADSVSTLGSQIFGTSEITKAVAKEEAIREEEKIKKEQAHQRPAIRDALRRNNETSLRMQAVDEEPRDQPSVELPRSFTGSLQYPLSFTGNLTAGADIVEKGTIHTIPSLSDSDKEVELTSEQIAEEELKAREQCITATKKHQELKRSGLPDSSFQVRQSEKILRDCYAQIEYWECLAEEAAANVGTNNSIISGNPSMLSGSIVHKFNTHGRNPRNLQNLDVDAELSKARDSYAYAIACHQSLVMKQARTSSPEWLKSQGKINESLANLKYWEGQASAFSPPPTICNSGTLPEL